VPIVASCECGKQLQAPDEDAGRLARCADCGRQLIIPLVGGPAFGAPPGAKLGRDGKIAGWRPGPPLASRRAVNSLALGLASIPGGATILFGLLLGIPAIVQGSLGLGEIKGGRGRIHGRGLAIAGIVTGLLGCSVIPIASLFGLVIPAVESVREADHRSRCISNLKQIGLAMHNYHSAHGCFPAAAIIGADGTPLLSWRVALLPYLEREALFRKFKLDEPWDGPHNKPLLAEMPPVFACPSDPASPATTTHYQGIVGPGALFDGKAGVRIADITDGTSNTLAAVEAKAAVPWTQPADLPFGPGLPPPAVGSPHPGGFNALRVDGSVYFMRGPTVSPRLITRNAGDP
jgi:prepilin-type processing-associated H-X9-DG protein